MPDDGDVVAPRVSQTRGTELLPGIYFCTGLDNELRHHDNVTSLNRVIIISSSSINIVVARFNVAIKS